MNELTVVERREFARLKKEAIDGLATMLDGGLKTGLALKQMAEQQLYREDYSSFEQFASCEFDLNRRAAYRAIEVVEVSVNLGNKCANFAHSAMPSNQGQFTELAKLDEDFAAEVWSEVLEDAVAHGHKPTAKRIKDKAEELRPSPKEEPKKPEPELESGIGESFKKVLESGDTFEEYRFVNGLELNQVAICVGIKEAFEESKTVVAVVNPKPQKGFQPPTVQQVRSYAIEAGLTSIDCDSFVDFYESKGWKVGSAKMKSWEASARQWNRRQSSESTSKPSHQKTSKELASEAIDAIAELEEEDRLIAEAAQSQNRQREESRLKRIG